MQLQFLRNITPEKTNFHIQVAEMLLEAGEKLAMRMQQVES